MSVILFPMHWTLTSPSCTRQLHAEDHSTPTKICDKFVAINFESQRNGLNVKHRIQYKSWYLNIWFLSYFCWNLFMKRTTFLFGCSVNVKFLLMLWTQYVNAAVIISCENYTYKIERIQLLSKMDVECDSQLAVDRFHCTCSRGLRKPVIWQILVRKWMKNNLDRDKTACPRWTSPTSLDSAWNESHHQYSKCAYSH